MTASINKDFTLKTATFKAGEGLSIGDVLQLYNGKLYKISPGSLQYNKPIEVGSACRSYGKSSCQLTPSLSADLAVSTDYDMWLLGVRTDNKLLSAVGTLEVSTTNDRFWCSIQALDHKRVIWAASEYTSGYAFLEVDTLEDTVWSQGTQITGITTNSGLRPDIVAMSDSVVMMLCGSITETKIYRYNINGSSITLGGGFGGTINPSVLGYSNQLLWLGGNKYAAKYTDGPDISTVLTVGGTVYMNIFEMTDTGVISNISDAIVIEGSSDDVLRDRAIILSKDRVLLATRKITTHQIYLTLIDTSGDTPSVISSIDSGLTSHSQYHSHVSLGFINPECFILGYRTSDDYHRFGIVKIVDDVIQIDTDCLQEAVMMGQNVTAVGQDMCNIDANRLLYPFIADAEDPWVYILSIGDNPFNNAIGVASETVSEGSNCEVVMQGILDTTGLGLSVGEVYYSSVWGDLSTQKPINSQQKNEKAITWKPNILEVGKCIYTNKFLVTMNKSESIEVI